MDRIRLPLSELTFEQKLNLIEELWENLLPDQDKFKSPDWHEEILREREEALKAGKIRLSDWEEAKKRISRKISCG